MSKLKIYDVDGACVGELALDGACVGVEKGAQALHEAVVAHMANRRAGTASTLRKGEVAGSNRKPWRQKGTGRARAGYRQSPVWRGGSAAFGPHPRSFKRRLPRRVARLAFRRAFSERVEEGAVRVLSAAPDLPEPKTRLLAEWLRRQGVAAPILLICDKISNSLRLAARNIPGIELTTAGHVNSYQFLRYASILVLRDAVPALEKRLGAEQG